jgi:ATP-dependent Clp protease adapter protein ClpS
MASSTIQPELIETPETAGSGEWMVVVYNNDVNTYEEVMTILMLATSCDANEAYIETWEIDHLGQCAVHRSSQDECDRVAEVIRTIGLVAETQKED